MADDEKTLIEILEPNTTIDISKYINFVAAPECGAVATFSGTTRDTFEGKTVVELRYEAYTPMAIRCIKSISASVRSSWSVNSIAVAHRLGPVGVGETSVFVAVSSVHRDDALDACKYVIDEIKASVPIWKKEVYSNGEIWKENSEFSKLKLEIAEKLIRGDLHHDDDDVNVDDKKLKKMIKSCCASKVIVVDDDELTECGNGHGHGRANRHRLAQHESNYRLLCHYVELC